MFFEKFSDVKKGLSDLKERNDLKTEAGWPCDATWTPSYDIYFGDILGYFGFNNFSECILKLSEHLGRKVRVLDLFGGAYFLEDLTSVSEIIGARLEDIDKCFSVSIRFKNKKFQKVIDDPKRKIMEANLYDPKSWQKLDTKDQDGYGFDLVVCRPLGPFFKRYSDLPQSKNAFTFLFYRLSKLIRINGYAFLQLPDLTDLSEENIIDFVSDFKMKNNQFEIIPERSSDNKSVVLGIRRIA